MKKQIRILIADDDEEDRELIHDAFRESTLVYNLHFVSDGAEVMDYLFNRGKYKNAREFPTPGIILLDLNMPKKDGREVLKEIRADGELRKIPVIILTTSKAEEDIIRSYKLGVNSFIIKPETFKALVEVTKAIGKYWLEIVELPL